ncbi:MAG: (2Fe-2S) ferredoxin domain-containing protein [Clostridiales bacterium]|nr:(2Fe-2S) ferredoxin domain-containing protein [Clostridiales bacterium]
MFEVLVCMESNGACKQQMAEEVLARFQSLIQENDLTGQVSVQPSPCLGLCKADGVTVQIGTNLYTGVTPANADYVFREYVLYLFPKQGKTGVG